jgi:hypothetical protein
MHIGVQSPASPGQAWSEHLYALLDQCLSVTYHSNALFSQSRKQQGTCPV